MFKNLELAGTHFLRGQLSLIASGPGCGKSIFALTLAHKSRASCLYFSADTDAITQLAREICIATGWSWARSMQAAMSDDIPAEVRKKLWDLPIRFEYNTSPTLDDIESTMESYVEVFGTFPELIVIDNIRDIQYDTEIPDDTIAKLDPLTKYLKDMAHGTQAHVMALHHVTGPYNDGDKPIPLSGLRGQPGALPELIITLFKTVDPGGGADILHASTVKFRGGRADASGNTYVDLLFDGDHMTVTDL